MGFLDDDRSSLVMRVLFDNGIWVLFDDESWMFDNEPYFTMAYGLYDNGTSFSQKSQSCIV